MTRIRQRTAQRLKGSLTTFNKVDMSRLMSFRKKNKDAALEKHGVKLGYMGPSARTIKEIPAINASIEGQDTIVYRDYVDISVAAAIPKGLVTPVLRNIESMSILEIVRRLRSWLRRYLLYTFSILSIGVILKI